MELYFKQNLCSYRLNAFILHSADYHSMHPVFQRGSASMAYSGPFNIYDGLYRGILVLDSVPLQEDADDHAAYPGRLYFTGPPPF